MSHQENPFKFGEVLSDDVKAAARQCPAFQDDVCPFAGKQTTAIHLPDSHLASSHEGSVAIKRALEQVHTEGSKHGDALSQCPVFSESSCPYKDSGLASLVQEMDLYSWGLRIDSLARALKDGTAGAHQEAETVQWVQLLLKRQAPMLQYALFLAMLYHVYDALEAASQKHALVEPFSFLHFPETLGDRSEAILADLNGLTASAEETQSLIRRALGIPVVRQYVQAINAAAAPQLVAHAYTRYLGDLSGGQIIKRAVTEAYQKQPLFYDFPGLTTNKKQRQFKQMYRNALDTLPVTAKLSHQMVNEANVAFRFNTEMFRYLDSLNGVVARAPPAHSEQKAKCPFQAATPSSKGKDRSLLTTPMIFAFAIVIVVILIAFDAASFV